MPRKLRGTLILSNLNSIHISIQPIILYKSYSIATPEPLEQLLLNNYVRIVALKPDLQVAFFYYTKEFFY